MIGDALPRLMGDLVPGDVVSSMGAGSLVMVEKRDGWVRLALIFEGVGHRFVVFHESAWMQYHRHDPELLAEVLRREPLKMWDWDRWDSLSVGAMVEFEGFGFLYLVTGMIEDVFDGEPVAVLRAMTDVSPDEGFGLVTNLSRWDLMEQQANIG